MSHRQVVAALSQLSASSFGVFRGRDAVALGVSRDQLTSLCAAGVTSRALPDTYRMTAVAHSTEQALSAALLWAGPESAAAVRSAAMLYRMEGVGASKPEIVVPRRLHPRSERVVVHRSEDRSALMVRTVRGLRATGVEATLVALAQALEPEQLEIACEDARRRRLTSMPALLRYLDTRRPRPGFSALRALLDELDPKHPSRSTLEVVTRRLLVAHAIRDFVREFPLTWNDTTYYFDFCFGARRTILETNGRRWHDDAADYEHDNEKWSVPGRFGYKLVLATWDKVTRSPHALLSELSAALAA